MSSGDVNDEERLADATAWIGQTVAEKFVLDRLLGLGGMGAVFEATNLWTGRKVAVKLLLQSALKNRDALVRLQQEARVASSIAHPHILDVLDMYRDQTGNCFIVSELLVGRSLEDLLRTRGKLDPYEAVEIIVPIAAALAAVHARGVVHRDVKPANIFLHTIGASLVPKLIDFGISKVTDESLGRTHTSRGSIVGTIDFMSPEQATGEAVDAQTDVWALGVVLFRLLTGALPFEGDSARALLMAIVIKRAPLVRDRAPDIDPDLSAIVDRMLEPERADRYASLEPVLRDLLAWADPLRSPTLSERFRAVISSTASEAGRAAQTPVASGSNVTLDEDPTAAEMKAPVGVVAAQVTKMEWQSDSDVTQLQRARASMKERAPRAVLAASLAAALVVVGVHRLDSARRSSEAARHDTRAPIAQSRSDTAPITLGAQRAQHDAAIAALHEDASSVATPLAASRTVSAQPSRQTRRIPAAALPAADVDPSGPRRSQGRRSSGALAVEHNYE